MKQLFVVLCFLCSLCASSQLKYPVLSEDSEINLITIGPGPELYDAFGHTAIQVFDKSNDINVVFNYGVFDFDTPNFYLKFARGKLLYKLAATSYDDFIYNYKAQERWIKLQELNLDLENRQATFRFLMHNLQEENKYYKYDFFYDNCATRPYYAIASGLGNSLQMDYSQQEKGLSHRDLIHQYIPWNSWGSLGIDVALGSVIDREATPEEYLFLPNELLSAFAKAKISTSEGNKPFTLDTITAYIPTESHSYGSIFVLSPLFIFSILSLLIIYKTYKDYIKKYKIGWLDVLLLSLTGFIGILISFLWLGTDHTATAWNYNLLWAFPFHILAAFIISKSNPPRWIYPYMKLAIILMLLLFFHWIIGVQKYPFALLPLLIAITMRYLFILRSLRTLRDS
ncbi:DUF4105 domain-containing protein [Dokdonia sp. Hel_I_53]|uniref:lipoprotein N-acyltransferase Lnb domain-containing protein n=1 Tax=Dokdonia sp. Hel_I_53 TaxID=1566287 RepID=UPI00119B721F|nr:DUF4105 domain-containing protein [Dokdonia sp. Hel_I_53]TVZ53406.1 uncharacterized protein DUF4105 [Dokdonia sp. Hel_I_53]